MLFQRWGYLVVVSIFSCAVLPWRANGENESITSSGTLTRADNEDDSWRRWERMSGEWGGLRSRLEEHGLDLGGGFIFDDSRGGIGGIRRRWAARGLLDIELTVDLEKLVGLADGTFYTDYQAFVGYDGSRDIGDIQAFANIDTNRRSQLAEFWYEQWLWNKAFRFKIGRVDANSEFAFVDHGADFINSSFGITPTAFVLPTYPDPASGANFFLYPTEHISFGFGLYDGAASRGVHTGVHGPDTLDGSDLFFIGELDFKWAVGPQALPGRIGLGGWGHNGRFERFSGAFQDGTTGAYMTLDQMAWREKAAVEDDPQGIGVFFQYGYADEAVSEVADHIGAGLIWTGAFAGRDEDILGIGVTYARLSDEADFVHDHETAVEWFYKVQLTPWLALKPDVQYIINPSGGGDIDDVLVGTVRVDVVF